MACIQNRGYNQLAMFVTVRCLNYYTLHYSLLKKQRLQYTVLPCIDGSYDDSVNCEKFKNYFASISTPNSKEYDQKMKVVFALKQESYTNDGQYDAMNSDCFSA